MVTTVFIVIDCDRANVCSSVLYNLFVIYFNTLTIFYIPSDFILLYFQLV